ncbi:MAG: FAD-dependent oxidoreductase [Candidatus Omnitrophota bacterium]
MKSEVKENIIVAGGGFAGLAALERLSKNDLIRRKHRLVLIDRKEESDFLPMAPDVMAGWLEPRHASVSLRKHCRSRNVEFIKGDIEGVDLGKKLIRLPHEEINFSYLVLSCGGEPGFFGNDVFKQRCLKLNSIQDAIKARETLRKAVKSPEQFNIVIIGGGYTGIEAAMACRFFLKRHGGEHAVITIVEKASDVLLMVPDWLRIRVRNVLRCNRINIRTGDSLVSFEGGTACFKKSGPLGNAFCIWSAGVITSAFIQNIASEKNRTRIIVDEYLRMRNSQHDSVFLAGDNAAFLDTDGNPIRMAVKFAIDQGSLAAANIVHMIRNEELEKYSPVDVGFLIPLMEGRAPGIVLGRRVTGKMGFFLHYFMCVFRSYGRNKWGILWDFMVSRRKSVS